MQIFVYKLPDFSMHKTELVGTIPYLVVFSWVKDLLGKAKTTMKLFLELN